ncbi:hypothetical protein GX408_19325 [bacterium]|nr:hypothetical protein [bacterium]
MTILNGRGDIILFAAAQGFDEIGKMVTAAGMNDKRNQCSGGWEWRGGCI